MREGGGEEAGRGRVGRRSWDALLETVGLAGRRGMMRADSGLWVRGLGGVG